MSYPSDVLNKGPWSHLTCVNGTRVMVSEGAAFVVAAQGGACLLAVGTFLQGRKKSGVSASQTPSPPGLPQTPSVRPQRVSLRLLESGGRTGCQFLTATRWPHRGRHPAAAFQARPPERPQINQTERTGPQPCLWCSCCPLPVSLLPAPPPSPLWWAAYRSCLSISAVEVWGRRRRWDSRVIYKSFRIKSGIWFLVPIFVRRIYFYSAYPKCPIQVYFSFQKIRAPVCTRYFYTQILF